VQAGGWRLRVSFLKVLPQAAHALAHALEEARRGEEPGEDAAVAALVERRLSSAAQ
jgi:hypothetical protein